MLRLSVLAVVFAAGAGALAGQAGTARPAVPPVTIVRAPDGAIQPQVAVDAAGAVHAVYFTGDPAHGDIFYTTLTRGGAFAPAVRVNSVPGSALATGSVRGAHMAIGRTGRVHVAWIGSGLTHVQPSPAPVLYTRLSPGGRSFEPQRNLMRRPSIGPDGASLAADASGRVYVFWHALAEGGKGEADRRLWLASSDDDGGTFAAERAVSDPAFGACACCGTGAFVSRDGAVYALFRAARDGVHRDSFLLTSTDRGATFSPTDVGPWDVNACPMSTYALAQDPTTGGIAGALETAGLVYLIRPRATTPGGDSFQAGGDVRNQKHPALAVNARGETLVAWIEGSGWNRGGALAWQVFAKSGNRVGERGTAPGVPTWGLVAAFARPDDGFTIVY